MLYMFTTISDSVGVRTMIATASWVARGILDHALVEMDRLIRVRALI